LQTLRLAKKLCDENHVKLVLVYRASGYDEASLTFERYRKEVAAFLKRDLPMDHELGVKRFRKQVEDMGIELINTADMKHVGINTRNDELEVAKHFVMADYFSDLIIRRTAVKHSSAGN